LNFSFANLFLNSKCGKISAMANLNVDLFEFINSFAGHNVVLDKAMIFAAQYLIYIVPFFLLTLWFIGDDKKKKETLFIFISILISLIFGWLITKFYYHPRPFVSGLGKELIYHAPDASFPSDHATVMFAVAFALLFLKDYRESVVFFALSFIVGFARIYCGIHFPYDILGGIPISLAGISIEFILKNKLDVAFLNLIHLYNKVLNKLKSLFVSKSS
jgi:undecaprenyl-diphosphatase